MQTVIVIIAIMISVVYLLTTFTRSLGKKTKFHCSGCGKD